jgi:hypothetical protein
VTREVYSEGASGERGSGRRFAIVLGASILLLFALTVAGLYAIFKIKLRHNATEKSSAGASIDAGRKN